MPKVTSATVKSLAPTQITVGMIEVADKKKQLAALKPPAQTDFLRDHAVPAVIGPQGKLYITDHHHLGRAALESGITTMFCEIQDDLSSRDVPGFWRKMEENFWVHPLDEHGVRHFYAKLPATLEGLVDDIYRSLAGYVRNAGGYDKSDEPYAEFVWADFFRRAVAVELVTSDFAAAVQMGTSLAKSHYAKRLPGYKGG